MASPCCIISDSSPVTHGYVWDFLILIIIFISPKYSLSQCRSYNTFLLPNQLFQSSFSMQSFTYIWGLFYIYMGPLYLTLLGLSRCVYANYYTRIHIYTNLPLHFCFALTYRKCSFGHTGVSVTFVIPVYISVELK